MLGLPRGKVTIAPYTDEWKKAFEAERELLQRVIGDLVVGIEHVGSTSIPGLAAKPIIDMAVFVQSLEVGVECIAPLTSIGYEYKQDAGLPGRHFFAKGPEENRTHYLHVEEIYGELWKNHIYFRDYLLRHREASDEYEALKRELAARYADDRERYAAGKDAFIKGILALAIEEARKREEMHR